ncbi:MAG: nitrous oxide-stimulated promoter family protein [Pseudomonadota bacterium]
MYAMTVKARPREVQGAAARRVQRELHTIQLMIGMYCRHHHAGHGGLCDDCAALWTYAQARIHHCPFRLDKPTCVNCPVHCYKPDRREQVRQVMRFAGPRMVWNHPVLAALHLFDGRRPAPDLTARRSSTETPGEPPA